MRSRVHSYRPPGNSSRGVPAPTEGVAGSGTRVDVCRRSNPTAALVSVRRISAARTTGRSVGRDWTIGPTPGAAPRVALAAAGLREPRRPLPARARRRHPRRCFRPGRARTRPSSARWTPDESPARRCRCRRFQSPLHTTAPTLAVSGAKNAMCAPVVTRSRPGVVPTACSPKSSLVPRPYSDVRIAVELALFQHGESKLGQRRLVHAPTRGRLSP